MTGTVLPAEVLLLALVNGVPLDGAWFTLTLPMRRKNPYRLMFGPGSPEGTLIVTRDEILREVKKVRDLFLMDYEDPALGWTGVIEVRVMNRSDIANVLLAYNTYRAADVYPSDMPTSLTQFEATLTEHDDEELTAEVQMQGGEDTRIRVLPQSVE